MANEKAKQRDQLIKEHGILIQPFVELIKSPSTPSLDGYRIARAKVSAGDQEWRRSVHRLCRFADDLFLNREYDQLSHVNERFLREIDGHLLTAIRREDLEELKGNCVTAIENLNTNFEQFLSEIPIAWEPEIFEANTPFTSYLKIKDTMSVVKERLHYFDRYLKPAFLETFLRNIDRGKEVRLVTTQGDRRYGVIAVSPISEMLCNEFNDYQLIESPRVYRRV